MTFFSFLVQLRPDTHATNAADDSLSLVSSVFQSQRLPTCLLRVLYLSTVLTSLLLRLE